MTSCFSLLIPTFEVVLLPVLKYIGEPEKYPFDEDIVLLISGHIKNCMAISDVQLDIFQHLPKVFNKNKYLFGNLFELMNLYLYYGAEKIGSSVEAMQLILEMGLKAMFVQSETPGAIS